MSNGNASQTSCAVLVSLRVAVWLTSPVVMRILDMETSPSLRSALLRQPRLAVRSFAALRTTWAGSGSGSQEGRHALHHRLGQRVDILVEAPAFTAGAEREALHLTGERHPIVGATI